MPPPVNLTQPSAKWKGTFQEADAWACQMTVTWPEEMRPQHGGRATENCKLYNFPTQAEAAAAADMLLMWRQATMGKPLTARQYNLGLERYK